MNTELKDVYRNQIENGELTISYDKNLFSLSFISDLNVQKLRLINCSNVILNLKDTLTELSVLNCDIQKAIIKHMSKLKCLYLGRNINIEISEISHLPNLKTVDLTACAIKNINCLKELNLEHLGLNYNRNIDINGLQNLKQLKQLFLSSCGIKDINILEKLPIEELDLSANAGLNLEPIKNIVSLKKLSVWGCNLKKILFLQNLTNLTDLNLSRNNNLYDITPLSKLNNLTFLNLAYTGLNETYALKTLTNLQNLDLSNNNIFEIEDLSSLKQLEKVNLEGNKIISFQALEKHKSFHQFMINESKKNELHRIYTILNDLLPQKALGTLFVKLRNRFLSQKSNWNKIRKLFNKTLTTSYKSNQSSAGASQHFSQLQTTVTNESFTQFNIYQLKNYIQAIQANQAYFCSKQFSHQYLLQYSSFLISYVRNTYQ
ncbi:leucine-rich_repeat domain-containing protein [Hexamita inflata]|uniref:Leucine-rich repeat domain-containing protein n=1 Tax=Hexamita inflata TaxID=28002 RepID=A0AA86THZ9_9EUKA|nr:leucine-rich repeat domain-containing protein [Hexamita inflata]